MSEFELKHIALNLIATHGLRAQAVAQEHLAEARQHGETAALERWQNIESAVRELRQTSQPHTRRG